MPPTIRVDDHVTKKREDWYNEKIPKVFGLSASKKQEGLIGLEIEAEGKNLFTSPFSYWACHQDGSLRPTEEGHPPQEYVLKKPLNLPEVEKALAYLDRKLKESGSEIRMSSRTSVHVHVNCQGMTVKELYCFILLYLIFEEVLVDWAGPERAGNLFCLRAKDSDYYIQMLEDPLKKKNFKLWKEELRYSACNIASVSKFGSLEFRALRGTVDTKMIMTWVEILNHLREESFSYDNPIEMFDKFTRIGPLPFFQQTFRKRPEFREILSQTSGLSTKLWDGVRMMRDVAYKCEWIRSEKKDPDDQEEIWSKPKICRNHVINHPEFGSRIIRAHRNGWGTPDTAPHTMSLWPPYTRGSYQIPPNSVIYYFEYDGDWIIVDCRESQFIDEVTPNTPYDLERP